MLYIIFHVFKHVYSPRAGADNPLGSEFLYNYKPVVTLVICCKFLPRPQRYIPSHKVTVPLVLEKKIFEGFLPYMGVAAICDPDPANKLSFPHPTEAPYEIWL